MLCFRSDVHDAVSNLCLCLSLLQSLIVETLHVVGLNVLLYRVMPRFSAIYALSLMFAVCSVPALFKLIFATSSGGLPKRSFVFMADVLALLVQLGAVAATVMVYYLGLGQYRYGSGDVLPPADPWVHVYWQVSAPCLVSCLFLSSIQPR